MTIKEALQAEVHIDNEALIDKILIDRALDASATYTAADHDAVEIASAFFYKYQALHPDFKEGGLSIKVNAKQLLKTANAIFIKYNMNDEVVRIKPKIKILNINESIN